MSSSSGRPPSKRLPGGGEAMRVGREPGAAKAAPPRASVVIGFGSPADDSGVSRLDLNELLIMHREASFLMRATGSAMREAGIADGDLLLIDRAITPAHGHVVIAALGDEFVCRRLHKQGGAVRLCAAAEGVPDLVPGEAESLEIWGVVTHAVTAMPV